MDKETNLKFKKQIVIGMIELWCDLLIKIEIELKREKMKKLLKEIKEKMYEGIECNEK